MPTFQLLHGERTDAQDLELLGRLMVSAWRTDGAFFVAINEELVQLLGEAFSTSKDFMDQSLASKKRCVSELSFSGYFSGLEYDVHPTDVVTTAKTPSVGGAAAAAPPSNNTEAWETFAVSKDLPREDPRVRANWPCHGPVPWPNKAHKRTMTALKEALGEVGDQLVQAVALGLGLGREAIRSLTVDGWHRLQTVHYPERSPANAGRAGLSSHTDNGMLVLVAQDTVGGLFIRPPVAGEHRPCNWLPAESTSGLFEEVGPWHRVETKPGTLVCFPGDTLQFLSGGYLLATMHRVCLSSTERFSFAYFHDPNFDTFLQPLLPLAGGDYDLEKAAAEDTKEKYKGIYYGAYFTRLLMATYPNRPATKRIILEVENGERRLAVLSALEAAARAKKGNCD